MRRKLLKLLLPLTIITSLLTIGVSKVNVSNDTITSEYIDIHSADERELIEGLPIVGDTFKFYNIKTESANFEFSYLEVTEDYAADKYEASPHEALTEPYYFDLVEGVHLYHDDVKMDIRFLESRESESLPSYHTASYELTGLTANTEYSNFTLGIEKFDEAGDFDKEIKLELTGDYIAFWTNHDLQYFIALIILLALMILIVVMSMAMVYIVILWHRHISMALYVDSKESFAHGEIVLDLVHANKYPEILNAHEEELKLYAEGREIDAIFRRDPNIMNGFKIYITEDAKDNKLPFLSMMEAQKYNGFYIGIENREYHAQYISDRRAKSIAKAHQKKVKNTFGDNREVILNEMNDEFRREISQTANHGLLGHISPNKSRRHSLRYKLLFPTVEELKENIKSRGKGFKMYHIYHGKAYEVDVEYAGIFGSMVEFDLVNLEPGTIYPGISVSFDNGKTIIPSSAIFGITRDRLNNKISKTDAKLAKPKEGVEGITIWPEDVAKGYVGEQVLESIKDILTKKHYEEEFDDLILPIDEAKLYHKDYVDVWFEEAKKVKDSRTGEVALKLNKNEDE